MKLSVYIPSYNQGAYLPQAIESILNQTLPADEIVIVDDASTDDSRAIAEVYQARFPDRIRLIGHTQNQGVAAARNTAMQAVTGDYITYLDADDRFLPDKLEREAARLQAPDQPELVYSDYYVINSAGERIDRWAGSRLLPEGDIFMQTFGRYFPQRRLFRCEMVNAAAWQRVGFYRPDLVVYEDYEMRIRLTKVLKAGALRRPLSEHRRHAEGLSRQPAWIFVDAFEKLLAYDLDLLKDLAEDQQYATIRQLDAWRAELLRRHSLELARGPGQRMSRMHQAWQLYQQSRRYDAGFHIWYFLQLFLPQRAVQQLRSWRGWLRRRRM